MSKKQKALLLALLDLSIAGLSNSLISMSPDTKQLLQNYLFTLPTWNKLKLSVYGNALRVYTIESNQLLINSILKKELTSYTLSNRCIILTILLNFISICIESNQDNLASNYLEFINRETSFPENFFSKNSWSLLYFIAISQTKQADFYGRINSYLHSFNTYWFVPIRNRTRNFF